MLQLMGCRRAAERAQTGAWEIEHRRGGPHSGAHAS
jgi:hypothetical protein